MDYTKEQFEKLPKWAQSEINRLKNENKSIKEKNNQIEGNSETNTFLVEGLDLKPLPKNSCVDFKTGKNNLNTVSVFIRKNGTIDVNTQSKLGQLPVIMPMAANSFHISFI
jgi:hypothetical protein